MGRDSRLTYVFMLQSANSLYNLLLQYITAAKPESILSMVSRSWVPALLMQENAAFLNLNSCIRYDDFAAFCSLLSISCLAFDITTLCLLLPAHMYTIYKSTIAPIITCSVSENCSIMCYSLGDGPGLGSQTRL